MLDQRKISYLLLLVVSVFIGYFILISEGFHGGGDSLAHFRIAKFSLHHPMYLLDNWGKPFFTLLAFPFAQFGFKGIQFFNLLLGGISCILTFNIARHFKWKFYWITIPLILATPIFLQEFFSGLTEVAFAAILLLVLFLRLKKRYAASFILLSFLPFVRTEAIVLIAWFFLLDLLEKPSWRFLLLLTGTIVYSVIGWVAKGDFLWLINEIPYTGGDHIYGSGLLLHYVNLMPEKIGWVILTLSAIAILAASIDSIKNEPAANWLLKYVVVPLVLYVGFHSAMWYGGRVSAGLPRILAAIVPLFAICALYSINLISNWFNKKWVGHGIALMIAGLVVWNAHVHVELPVKLGQEEKTLKSVADYIRANNLINHKIHYYSLYSEMTLNLDPHNKEQCQQVIHTRDEPERNVEAGSLVIWDAHFSPNEGAMPLENLTESPYFELLEVFEPERPFTTIGNQPYKVYLFYRKEI